MRYPEHIWQNGAIKPWADATTHVMSHALHYGSSVFEGIRCYETQGGHAIFRLTDHTRRLFASAKIYDIVIPYTVDEINAACREVIRANNLGRAYLRPIAYRGLGGFGLSADTPTDVAVAAWDMGPYLGPDVLEAGIDACVSSWQRFAPNTIPAGAKAGGNYLSGQLVAREARRLGFGEGIALASTGLLSEGAGENLFLVFDGALHMAQWVAANVIAETRLRTAFPSTGRSNGDTTMGQQRWHWELVVAGTDEPRIRRLDVTVTADDAEGEGVAAALTGFVSQP